MADNFLVKDANNLNMTVRSVDLGSDLHVPLHGRFYRDIPDVTGTLSAVGNTVIVDVKNTTGLMLTVAANPSVSGANIQLEASLNSTNGVDGMWVNVSAQRSDDASQLITSVTGISANLTYALAQQVSGYSWFRVRCTAITSGSLLITASPCDDLLMPSRAMVSQPVTGQSAHDAAISGNPVRIGARATNVMLSPVSATNEVSDIVTTMQGVPVVTLDTVSAQRLRASVALSTTTDVQVFAGAAAGLSTHLTDMQIVNTGVATDLIIKQGTTEIWRLPLPPNVPVMVAGLRSPLVVPAATVLNATLSVASTVRLNAQGYVAV